MWLDKGGGTFTEETCFKQHMQLVWWNQFRTLPHTNWTIIWLVAVEMSDDEDVLVLWWWLQNKKKNQRYWIHPLMSDRQHNSYVVSLKGENNWKDFIQWINLKFYIHMSMHRKCNSKLQPTSCNFSWFIHFYRRCARFRRFLRPSSRAHDCTHSFRYCQPILLLAAIMDETERRTHIAVLVDNTWSCMYSFVLLMMGGGTAWNM